MSKGLSAAIAAAIALVFCGPGPSPTVYAQSTPRAAAADETPAGASAADQAARADAFESAGQSRQALGAYRALVRKFPDSPAAPKAQFKVAELLEREGDYNAAFDDYTTYLTKYPKGDQFAAAVAAQFQIAKLFLEGERTKLFGMKAFPSMVRAQEMFEAIIKNAPYSKEAPAAQFYVGQSLEKQGKLPEALDAYQTVLAKYAGDPVAADAQYQIGYAYLTRSRQGAYDPAMATRAREAFEDFIARYSSHEKVPQAKENIKVLAGGQTKGTIEIARFYDHQKNYKAAAIYYNEVIRIQPGSDDAAAAKTRVDELRELVGEDALRAGPEKPETGARARARRRMQAQIDTAARPDYNGPPVTVPEEELPPAQPQPRTSPRNVAPIPAVEPELPNQ